MISCRFGASRQLSLLAIIPEGPWSSSVGFSSPLEPVPLAAQRRSDRADHDSFRRGPGDDESTDEHIIAGLHPQPRGDVRQDNWRWRYRRLGNRSSHYFRS